MTVIFPSPIFGPVHSRRLGVSLGINLLPDDAKVCSFDCIYCESGYNAEHRTKKLPTREEVRTALEEKLKDMQANGPAPDVLTFAGNGEPTAHPHFPEIIDDTLALRDKYFPKAKVSVLSNSTFIDRPAVFDALNKIDNNILKLDTVFRMNRNGLLLLFTQWQQNLSHTAFWLLTSNVEKLRTLSTNTGVFLHSNI